MSLLVATFLQIKVLLAMVLTQAATSTLAQAMHMVLVILMALPIHITVHIHMALPIHMELFQKSPLVLLITLDTIVELMECTAQLTIQTTSFTTD